MRSDLEQTDEAAEVEWLEEELRRARSALKHSDENISRLATALDRQMLENELLEERARIAQNQMRLMRKSAVWRVGSSFRLAKRAAGKFLRNVRDVVKGR